MKAVLILILSLIGINLSGQTLGDECIYAQFIDDVSDYCSGETEFSTVGMTASVEEGPNCWPVETVSNDIWFAFRPEKLGFYVGVFGDSQFSSGTLQSPSVAIYTGTCGSLTLTNNLCGSVLLGDNLVELTNSDVQIGQTYYIRIDARDNNTGSFQLCIKEFNPAKAPESDCKDAVLLCDKSPFFVEDLEGVGEDINEISFNSCIREEFASVWYKWVCDDSGSLEFTLTPNNAPDDIDFAVYRLPGGLDDCANKELVRCMASGETIGAGTSINDPCFGETGLSLSSTDITENPGCATGDDNFVSALDMISGEAYVLVVNNFSVSGYGFSIDFGGTGTFLGPEPDFHVEALEEFECDKTIRFIDDSNTITDPITSYSWNFGAGSNPSRAEGPGPHLTAYESYGDKIAALTIETSRGCKITKIVEFYIEPCCADVSDLEVTAVVQDVSCFGYSDGSIISTGVLGNPQYEYRIDDENLQPIPFFGGLSPGDYEIGIVDIKGCRDSITVTIEEPPQIIVYAGQDTTVELGDDYTFGGSFTPAGNYTIMWDPDDLFDGCTDCLDPHLFPTGTQQYILTVTDENGCFGQDSILVRVEIIREVDAPNIFNPNSNSNNAFFNIFANKAAVGIEELLIFDRWGNKIYKGSPLLNNLTTGWDGTYNGQDVDLGVYTWLARVLFLDGKVLPYSGDITVMK